MVFTVSLTSKHVTCLGVTLERKVLQASSVSWFGEERFHHFEGNLKYKWPVLYSEYVMNMQLYIYSDARKCNLTAVPLSGTNARSCTTHGAVSTSTLPFPSKVMLNLFQPSPPQVRLLTKAVRMVWSRQAEFPHVHLFLFLLEVVFWMKTHLWWGSCPKAGCSHAFHFLSFSVTHNEKI